MTVKTNKRDKTAGTDWPAIRLDFVNGHMTFEQLGERHNINAGTIRQRAARDKARGDCWHEARNAVTQVVTQVAQAELIEVRSDALKEFNAADLELSRQIRDKCRDMLTSGLCANEEGEVSALSPRDLNAIAKAAESAQKIGRLALGVSTDNVGLGGPNGQGPVPVTSIPQGEYAAALRAALAAF